MKKTKNIFLGLGTLALILGIYGSVTSSANTYRGDPTVKGPNYSIERHTAMEKAFETNDYIAWKNLMGNQGRVTQVINKDNFAKFSQAHELAEKGDLVGAQKIRQELGLGLNNGSLQGIEKGIGRGNHVNR
jgi:hypothetical protein